MVVYLVRRLRSKTSILGHFLCFHVAEAYLEEVPCDWGCLKSATLLRNKKHSCVDRAYKFKTQTRLYKYYLPISYFNLNPFHKIVLNETRFLQTFSGD